MTTGMDSITMAVFLHGKSKRITENLIGTGTACVSVPILETKDRIRRT